MFNTLGTKECNWYAQKDFKSRVLFGKASIFNARGIWNPGKVRRRVFEVTSQICIFQMY